MMVITHKNTLTGYLGNWHMAMDIKARAEGKPSSELGIPQPVQSLIRHELNLCLMLELLDERLTRFTKMLNEQKGTCDFAPYSEALAFLDAVYFFAKLLLDSLAGVIRDVHKRGTGRELTTRFNVMFNKSLRGQLPDGLNAVFQGTDTWFPGLKKRRDDIMHRYETYLIGIERDSEGGATAVQFATRERSPLVGGEDLRSYIGTVMSGYQCFVDRLLDYWDEVIPVWYGVSVFRNLTGFLGRGGNILWWAYRFGEYRNADMSVCEG